MKKYGIIAIAACLMLGTLTSCGGTANKTSEATTESQADTDTSWDLDSKEYVKLGEYKGMTIPSVEPEKITEEKITETMNEYAADEMEYKEVTDRDTVKEGDTVEVDLTCLIGGELDDAYSGTDIQIEVGSKNFSWIPDVEIDVDSELIGAKIGETIQKKFEYPTNYAYDNYAGKEGVLQVTIHKIMAEELPKITDAWVQRVLGVDSIEVWKTQIREELEDEQKEIAENATTRKMWEQIEANSQQIKEFPAEFVEERVEKQKEFISQNAAYSDMDEAEYRKAYMDGLTVEEFVKQEIFEQCIKDLIAKSESLKVSDEEIDTYLEDNTDGAMVGDKKELLEFWGGKEALRTELLNEKVEDFLKKANTFE